MFGNVTRRSLPLSGILRSCKKSDIRLPKHLRISLQCESSAGRYISTTNVFFYSKQSPKEKYAESQEKYGVEINLDKDEPKENATKVDNQNFEAENKNETEEKKSEEENKEKSSSAKKNWKSNLFASDLMLHSFANSSQKNQDTFLECLRMYKNSPGRKRERVSFIYAALKYMEEFGVHKDLEVYKQIIDIFPKESMVPTNQFQAMFMHYPKEQYCCTAVLEQMEDNSVIPDPEMELQLLNIFGRHGMPLEKYWKMMYWMPKFKNLNPWPVPKPLPIETLELAKLAMVKISSVDVESSITVFDTEDIKDSIDNTWIVSAMAPKQNELLLKHDKKTAIYVEGPFRIYVATKSVDYFTLRAEPPLNRKYPDYDPDDVDKLKNPYLETQSSAIILPPSVHEQVDSTIFANCATGTSTKDSLLSWIRCLQKENPVLGEIPIIFRLSNYAREENYIESGESQKVPGSESSDKKFLKDN